MKKFFVFFAVFATLIFVAGCGGSNSVNDNGLNDSDANEDNDSDVNDNGVNDRDTNEDNSDADEVTEQCDLEPYHECRGSDSYYCQPNSSCEYECELFEYCDGCCFEGICAYDCCYLESYSECRGSDLYYCDVQHPCQYECELTCEDCCGS